MWDVETGLLGQYEGKGWEVCGEESLGGNNDGKYWVGFHGADYGVLLNKVGTSQATM